MTRRLLILLLATNLIGCEKPADNTWQGYIEGEYVLHRLALRRAAAEALRAPRRQGRGGKAAVRARAGKRARGAHRGRAAPERGRRRGSRTCRRRAGAPEIDALRAEVTQAKAALELSASQLAQQQKLFKEGFISQARLDEAQAARDARRARASRRPRRSCSSALLPLGRDAERKAAEGDVAAAQAALAQAAWRLEQKSVAAPVSGLVQDTFFVEGEWVPAGTPVVVAAAAGQREGALLRARNRRSASLQPGQGVEIRCDGCPAADRRQGELRLDAGGVHAAGDLQQGVARQARVPGRGAARRRRRAACSPGQPVDVTAEVSELAIDVRGLNKSLRRQARGEGFLAAGARAARSTASSARTAAARPPRSACCAACSSPTPARAPASATT